MPVAAQTSAQSRFLRMHSVSSATMSSARQASAQAVQVWAHSKHAAMHSASFCRSMSPRSFG